MCGTDLDFRGIQGFISDGTSTIALTPMGSQFQCVDYDIKPDNFIAKVVITYTEGGDVKHMQALDQDGIGLERGRASIKDSDLAYEVTFDKYEALAGFVGYEDTEVKSIGFYRYMCATRPDDVTGEAGTGDIVDDGETTDQNGTGENDENDTSLASDTKSTAENELKTDAETDDEEDSLSLILIILVCILVPLVFILGSIVWLFRKNRQNAIKAANFRRLSAVKQKHAELDEKMEAKGKAGVVDIFADEKKQGTGILGKAIFDQVPTDEEIRELLKGKTSEEKRTLLKEIEKARQAKIHMTYLMEQQKLKHDEKC